MVDPVCYTPEGLFWLNLYLRDISHRYGNQNLIFYLHLNPKVIWDLLLKTLIEINLITLASHKMGFNCLISKGNYCQLSVHPKTATNANDTIFFCHFVVIFFCLSLESVNWDCWVFRVFGGFPSLLLFPHWGPVIKKYSKVLKSTQSFSALKKIACARAQRSYGNFESRSRSRSIFLQFCARARAQ